MTEDSRCQTSPKISILICVEVWGQTPFVMITRFGTIEVPLQQCPNTVFPTVIETLGVGKAITTTKQVCKDTPRSVLATCITWVLEDLKTARESRYKVPAQVPMLPGICRCPQVSKEWTKTSQEITVPHLSYPHCHGSPSLLSNHIIRLDASQNWALCWKIFCYMRVLIFWLITMIKFSAQAGFSTSRLLQLRGKKIQYNLKICLKYC